MSTITDIIIVFKFRVTEGESLYRGVCGEIEAEIITGSMFCSCSANDALGCLAGGDFVHCPISPAEANSE